jgi:hypothetical protein
MTDPTMLGSSKKHSRRGAQGDVRSLEESLKSGVVWMRGHYDCADRL